MVRLPPTSTLFPYTTLFRSEPSREAHLVAHPGGDTLLTVDRRQDGAVVAGLGLDVVLPVLHGRSEEHTSELQSHVNLVCRLLLEKKKTPDVVHIACFNHNNA